MRHLVAALLLARKTQDIQELALPIILEEKLHYSDSFT